MLYVDKYRPHAFKDFELNSDIADNLKKLVASGDFPHTLFYGPPGAGKKTLVLALLRELFGSGVEKVKIETKPWQIELPNRKIEVELTMLSSNYHVEMSPGDVGNNDRYVVQAIIKEMARSRPLDVSGNKGFKILVLNDVDALSREAQQSLRRTMEKYSAACRLVMCCSNVSRVMDPVRSRCMCIRVGAPSDEQVVHALQGVAAREGFTLPHPLAGRIAAMSARNLRKALLQLEVCRAAALPGPLTEGQAVQAADWELYIGEVAGDMLSEQSPKRLYQVRCKLYELLANCIPPSLLLRTLLMELLKKLDAELQVQAVHWAAFYEHRLQEGSKAIFHLEAFVAKFMSIYKTWTISMME